MLLLRMQYRGMLIARTVTAISVAVCYLKCASMICHIVPEFDYQKLYVSLLKSVMNAVTWGPSQHMWCTLLHFYWMVLGTYVYHMCISCT